MPKKRSRVGQSNSFLDVGVMNQHPSPELRLGAALPANFPDQSRQSVLTVSSPPLMCEAERSGFERCSQCNKMLDQSKDIYMYRDSAFCTNECRIARIATDQAAEEMAKTTSGKGMLR
ncbi:hypothetical protein JCGZ_21893 [Jatropha curcas]|uniref:FLZ-type domain-containing protein n=1 Tax=Jatropha curcas TaxID=180498 RepID=A0A067JC84_JATCU|nr:uncharacterized protein LOC105649960 isoform X1 [Jatropha curcas]KDP21422.1 hypothetical protein JCGZ_21893 [Jatropha curcas]